MSQIEDSLEIAAVGSMRRNGSYPEGDNLTPAYSNPALMRAWYVSWIGERRKNEVCFISSRGSWKSSSYDMKTKRHSSILPTSKAISS